MQEDATRGASSLAILDHHAATRLYVLGLFEQLDADLGADHLDDPNHEVGLGLAQLGRQLVAQPRGLVLLALLVVHLLLEGLDDDRVQVADVPGHPGRRDGHGVPGVFVR